MLWSDIVDLEDEPQLQHNQPPSPIITQNYWEKNKERNAGVTKYLNSNIFLQDTNSSLRMYNYSHCDNNSDDNIKNSRSVIRKISDSPDCSLEDKLVCKTFNYTPTYTIFDTEQLSKLFSVNSKFYSYERGNLVSLFYYSANDKVEGKWYLSTRKNIDSDTTKFTQLIKLKSSYENFNDYTATLNKDKIYTYIMTTEIGRDNLYFVGSFNKLGMLIEGNDSGIGYPKEYTFNTYHSLINFVKKFKKEGIIVYQPNGKQYIVNFPLDVKKFKKYLTTNISTEIQKNTQYDMLIEYAISDLTKLYIIKYIKHQTIKYNEYLFELLKQFHKWHKADKSHNRISEDYIRKIFYNLSGDERIQLFKQLNYI